MVRSTTPSECPIRPDGRTRKAQVRPHGETWSEAPSELRPAQSPLLTARGWTAIYISAAQPPMDASIIRCAPPVRALAGKTRKDPALRSGEVWLAQDRLRNPSTWSPRQAGSSRRRGPMKAPGRARCGDRQCRRPLRRYWFLGPAADIPAVSYLIISAG